MRSAIPLPNWEQQVRIIVEIVTSLEQSYREDGESPEGGSMEEAHYLMQPWHAIEMAMQGEKRAVAFFRHVAETTRDDKILKMALELVAEEEEHVALLQKWQDRYPKPDDNWDDDLDPPTVLE